MNIRSWFFMSEDDYARHNPPWPVEVVEDEEGDQYVRYVVDRRWLHMGHIPRPQTRLGWFVHDLVHGLLMRYPVLPVIVFAVRRLGDRERMIG